MGPLKSEEFIEHKLLWSAETMDMNNNHHCHNKDLFSEGKKSAVIFLGSNSSIVLYKEKNEFDITECNPLNRVAGGI